MSTNNQRLLTVNEVANFLRCSIPSVYRYVSQKKIPFIKQNHWVLFDLQDLQAWIESKKIQPSNFFNFNSINNEV